MSIMNEPHGLNRFIKLNRNHESSEFEARCERVRAQIDRAIRSLNKRNKHVRLNRNQ